MPTTVKNPLPRLEADATLPLFFARPAVLNPERHSKAGIRLGQPLEFARATNSLPLNAVEFVEAAKTYPVAFTLDESPLPVALVGLEHTNLFLNAEARWQEGCYIPAYVRKHPFLFAQAPDSDQLMLCVDEDYPHFMPKASGADIARLFDHGNPTDYTRNAMSFCTAFHQDHRATQRFCARLKELNLFEPNRSDITLATGRKIVLTGFQLIDQKKLAQLPGDAILQLHQQGWLSLIHAAIFSTSNWQKLLDRTNVRENK